MRRLRPPAAPTALAAVAVALFAASPAITGSDVVHAAPSLTTYGTSVGPDARASVDVEYDAGGYTHVELVVSGLAPRTRYVGRARVGGCAPMASRLGPVFQMFPNPDPETPYDPLYRNPGNEVWLDVETDAHGAGSVRTTQKWQFHPLSRPGSVTIHDMLRMNRPTDPMVGAALACLEVAF